MTKKSALTVALLIGCFFVTAGASECSDPSVMASPSPSVSPSPSASPLASPMASPMPTASPIPEACKFTPLSTSLVDSYPTPTLNYQSFCDLPPPNSGANGIIAMSGFLLAHDVPCGSCVQVTGATGSALAIVTDVCPDCDDNSRDFELDATTFQAITGQTSGSATIQWQAVPCNPSGNISVAFENSGPFFLQMRFPGVKFPVKFATVVRPNGTEYNLRRTESQRWTSMGGDEMGEGPFDIAITSIFDERVVAQGVPLNNVDSLPWQSGTATNVQFNQCAQ